MRGKNPLYNSALERGRYVTARLLNISTSSKCRFHTFHFLGLHTTIKITSTFFLFIRSNKFDYYKFLQNILLKMKINISYLLVLKLVGNDVIS